MTIFHLQLRYYAIDKLLRRTNNLVYCKNPLFLQIEYYSTDKGKSVARRRRKVMDLRPKSVQTARLPKITKTSTVCSILKEDSEPYRSTLSSQCVTLSVHQSKGECPNENEQVVRACRCSCPAFCCHADAGCSRGKTGIRRGANPGSQRFPRGGRCEP